MSTTTNPRVYVGTYAKYNAGSIAGEWLDLEDKDSFLDRCRELHADEQDPELMFQDFEGFPRAFYSESSLDDRLWEWLELDDDQREIVSVALSSDPSMDVQDALDTFMGKYQDEEAWAMDYLDQSGFFSTYKSHERGFDAWREIVERYFDFEAYAQVARLNGDVTFIEHEGEVWVFSH